MNNHSQQRRNQIAQEKDRNFERGCERLTKSKIRFRWRYPRDERENMEILKLSQKEIIKKLSSSDVN